MLMRERVSSVIASAYFMQNHVFSCVQVSFAITVFNHSVCCFVQIVSSAIVNAPPPQTFMKLLHKTSKADLVSKPQTREKMVRIFKGRLTGDKLLAQRQVQALLPHLYASSSCAARSKASASA